MLLNNSYSVQDWYWQVGSDTSKVFSSERMQYVAVSDSTYTQWLSDGNQPTNILTPLELYNVLVQQWVPPYLLAGIQVNSTGSPALNGVYSMDPQTQGQITGIATSITAGRGLPGGSSTFIFQSHMFNQTQFLNFAAAAESYVYALYQALGQIILTGTGSLPSQPVIMP